MNALMHTKGYAAPETKAAIEQARSLMERAEALGEPPEDPLLLFSILYGSWTANYVGRSTAMRCTSFGQFSVLAQKQRATGPLMIGHRVMGLSLSHTGDFAEEPGAL